MKLSILGDSISTYEGMNPPGYAVYYEGDNLRASGLKGAEETWWGQVTAHFGWTLLVNGSWSGSYVAGLTPVSAHSEMRVCDLADGETKPDLILICMGANDCGDGRVPLHGQYDGDEMAFDTSYRLMLTRLAEEYPDAALFCATIPLRQIETTPSMTWAVEQVERFNEVIRAECRSFEQTYPQCRLLDVFDKESGYTTCDRLHPDRAGHTLLADRFIALLNEFYPEKERL